MITMAYNPVRDKGILEKEYNWSYDILNISNMDKEDIKNNILLLHRNICKTNKIDKNFNVPYYVDFRGCSVLVKYKDGSIKESILNITYSRNTISIDGKTFSKINWNKIDKIMFYDNLMYHDRLSHKWSKDGFTTDKETLAIYEEITEELKGKL